MSSTVLYSRLPPPPFEATSGQERILLYQVVIEGYEHDLTSQKHLAKYP